MRTITHATEKRYVASLFFLFGFGGMAWIPRFPEVKSNLGLSNGQFGTLISAGAIGTVIGMLTVGHIVHKYGSQKILILSAALLFSNLALIVRTHSSFIFLISNTLIGLGFAGFHISLHGQAFLSQEKFGRSTIPLFHGMWTTGSLVTAILSGILVDRVPLVVHIDSVAWVSFLAIVYIIWRINPVALEGKSQEDDGYSFKTIFTSIKVDWLVSTGLIFAIFLEFVVIDWAAIFTKEELHMSAGLSVLPYVLFSTGMISGRLNFDRIAALFPLQKLVVGFSLFGGFSFLLFVGIASYFTNNHRTAAFWVACLGFLLAGVGSSFLGPTFVNAGNRRSSAPSGVVVGQLGLISNLMAFILKTIFAWIAQIFGLTIALVIPAVMLICVFKFSKAVVLAK